MMMVQHQSLYMHGHINQSLELNLQLLNLMEIDVQLRRYTLMKHALNLVLQLEVVEVLRLIVKMFMKMSNNAILLLRKFIFQILKIGKNRCKL